MPVSIQGIRVDNVDIVQKPDDGDEKVSGNYSLMSNNGKVLAKQAFNGYSETIKVNLPADTVKAKNAFMKLLKRDIETVLGMEE